MLVKTFTATRRADRETLGEMVTEWIRANPNLRVLSKAVRQSSDKASHHCITITLCCEGAPWPA